MLLYETLSKYAFEYEHMQMHILAILKINAYNAYFTDFEPINAYFGDLKKKYA